MSGGTPGGVNSVSPFGQSVIHHNHGVITTTIAQKKDSRHHRKLFVGVILMTLGGLLWATASQLTKSSFNWPTHFAPLFLCYLITSGLLLHYPLYFLVYLISCKCRAQCKDKLRESIGVFYDDTVGFRLGRAFGKISIFVLLWIISAYTYARALHMKPVLDIMSLFATNSSFVYLLSWIILQKQFMALRIVSFVFALTGVCLLTYKDGGFANESLWGCILAVTSTATVATYRVLFRKLFGDVTFCQSAFFVTVLGFCSLLFMLPLLLLLSFTKVEPLQLTTIPWWTLIAIAASCLVLSIILLYGSSVSYSVFTYFGIVFAVPLCVPVDIIWRNEKFVGMQIAAVILIIISCFMNVLPENWYATLAKICHWKQSDSSNEKQMEQAILSPRERLRSSTQF